MKDEVELSKEAQAWMLEHPQPKPVQYEPEQVEGGAIAILCMIALAFIVVLLIAMVVGLIQSFAAMVNDDPGASAIALVAAWCGITAWFGSWSLDIGG